MLHRIDTTRLGPHANDMAQAIQACVHCGFCLAACPTYRELGQEMDSPRGRILLMKETLEGSLPFEAAQPHIDRCLGCLACEPACPSGVPYRDLISPFRALAEPHFQRSPGSRLRRALARWTLPHPDRFRLALVGARLGRWLRPLVPAALRPMLDLAPARIPRPADLAPHHPAQGSRRARVALLAGCAQQVLDPDINLATIDVLTRNGVEVVVPREQGCCGGLAWHTGDLESAREFARANLRAFPRDIDAIVTNAAGCGSALHEYGLILKATPQADEAREVAAKALDASAFLDRLGLAAPIPDPGRPVRIAYHDACHLANAQGVRNEPRRLLNAIPGVTLVEIPDGHLCCGSAGTYNLDQPDIAAALGRAKARAAAETAPDLIASGNIGCLIQLRTHAATLPGPIQIRHTFQVLRDAYRPAAR